MNANELIEAYVADVAVQLPRKQRNDVAFELRALLQEELHAKAGDAGREPDAPMALELLRAFGHPADVAGRYKQPLTIVDPEDGHDFLRAAMVGLVLIWGVGLLMRFQTPVQSAGDLVRLLGMWWGTTVVPSLWWPGCLVVCYAGASWARRTSPRQLQWQPRAHDRIRGGRVGLTMAILGIMFGLTILVDPRVVLELFWGGRAAPAAYQALTYTDSFRSQQAPLLLALIILNIPLMVGVILDGRWTGKMRNLYALLGLVTCGVMAWTIADSPMFMAEASDKTAKFAMAAVIVISVLVEGWSFMRRVRPEPQI